MLAINGGEPYRNTKSKPFPARTPYGEDEIQLVSKALRSQNLFRWGGKFTADFEAQFAKTYGSKFGVGSTSGTAALHLAIGALDPDPGDEVITSAITDIGTIIPILSQNAVPVFADMNIHTLTVDPHDIEQNITSKTRAIIAVHLFGNACQMDILSEISKRYNIPLIEDCSQAHLTRHKGKYLGTFGNIGCFSFQQSKHMTTGDGRMSITNDHELDLRMRRFMDKSFDRSQEGSRTYGSLGMNYRMTELHSAVGLAQLKKLTDIVDRKTFLGNRLSENIRDIPGITPAPVTPGTKHSYWSYPMLVTRYSTKSFTEALIAEGISASAGYIGDPIFECSAALAEHRTYGSSQFPFDSLYTNRSFEQIQTLCPQTRKILDRLVLLPFNENFSNEDVDDIAGGVRKVAEELETC